MLNLLLPGCDWLTWVLKYKVQYDAEGELGGISDYMTVYYSYSGCYFCHACFMSGWQTYWGIDEMLCTCYASCSLVCDALGSWNYKFYELMWVGITMRFCSLCLWSWLDMYDTTLNYSSYFVLVQHIILLACENVSSICKCFGCVR
jgi:hypothetical protein